MAAVTVCACTLPLIAAPAGADQLSDAQAKAAAIEAELAQTGQQISALGQQYDAAELKANQLSSQISATRAKITADQTQVNHDQTTLQKAAVNAYVQDGSASTANPLFSNNQKSLAAQQEYTNVADGDLNVAVDNLHAAQGQLSEQQASLQGEESQAQNAAQAAQSAEQQASQAQAQQNAALSQAKGQIASIIAAQQQAAAAAAAAAAQAKIASAQRAAAAQATAAASQAGNAATAATNTGGSASGTPAAAPAPVAAPPGDSRGAAAVAAAESQLGVPYQWGAESPGAAFDCSGLTAWAWGQAGVPLPHYSGAQMADSTPVPISDLQPGDLLFYGPGGSEHVAMYIGGGQMIEAPYTGAVVWVTGLRLGDGFAGAGRP